MRSGGEETAPSTAIQRASCTSALLLPESLAAAPITAAAPAAPPTTKYVGISQVQPTV
jgi:hypothetical protein